MRSGHFIGNAWVSGRSGKRIDYVVSSTGGVLVTIPAGGAAGLAEDLNARVADALDAGITWQNCNNMVVIQAPWGGMKKSGMGRELGRWGLESFLEPKQKTRWLPGGGVGWYDVPAEAAE